MRRAVVFLSLLIAACGDDSVVCGVGTTLTDGVCLPHLTGCGPGTTLNPGGICVAIDAAIDAPAIDAATDAALTCGAGTHRVGDECVPDTGGSGFEVRVAQDPIAADGYTKIAVIALGPEIDGGASGEAVTLAVVPANAGTIDQPNLTLGPGGTSTFLTPCNSVLDASCIESFQIVMTAASDPQMVLATSRTLHTVAPTPIGSAAPCVGGGNRMFLDGDDYIFTGMLLVADGEFLQQTAFTPVQRVRIYIYPGASDPGGVWDLVFSSERIGQPLRAQVYQFSERWPFQAYGLAGLKVMGDGNACDVTTGAFQIEELVLEGATVRRFTATFIQHCEAGPTTLTGCVHFEQ